MKRLTVGVLVIVMVLVVSSLGEAAGTYVVAPGDTLWLIAQRYGTTVDAIAGANSLSSTNYIEVGQRLVIPGADMTYVVRPGDTLWLISQRYNTTVDAIAQANGIRTTDYLQVGERLIIPTSTSAAGSGITSPPSASTATFSAADLDLMARLVQAESGAEPYTGQVAVAATVLNRIRSPQFPNTPSGVIYQVVNGHYQYSPVLDGRINLPANDSARRAVQDAINGWDPSNGATGFYNPAKTTNSWIQSQPVTAVIGNHVFYR